MTVGVFILEVDTLRERSYDLVHENAVFLLLSDKAAVLYTRVQEQCGKRRGYREERHKSPEPYLLEKRLFLYEIYGNGAGLISRHGVDDGKAEGVFAVVKVGIADWLHILSGYGYLAVVKALESVRETRVGQPERQSVAVYRKALAIGGDGYGLAVLYHYDLVVQFDERNGELHIVAIGLLLIDIYRRNARHSRYVQHTVVGQAAARVGGRNAGQTAFHVVERIFYFSASEQIINAYGVNAAAAEYPYPADIIKEQIEVIGIRKVVQSANGIVFHIRERIARYYPIAAPRRVFFDAHYNLGAKSVL